MCAVRAAVEENAYSRMKQVVRWYVSGFYKKPKVRGHACVGRPAGRVWGRVVLGD